MEADPTACYEDADGDGYGDMDPSSSDMEDYGVIAGTDCYDSSWVLHQLSILVHAQRARC